MKWSLFLLTVLLSCGKGNNFVHTQNPFKVRNSVETHDIVSGGGKLDIVWIVDNSSSMSPIQNAIIDNAAMFMNEFILLRNINWNMGIISTDSLNVPFLGFNPLFMSGSPTPTATFQAAMRRVGIGGSTTERSYTPLMEKLTGFPQFLRKDAYLIVIFVTDAVEQSNAVTTRMFLDDLYRRKGGFRRLVKAYGALHAIDRGCAATSESPSLVYASSKYKEAIDETNGKVFSTCVPNFGRELATLAQDVVSTISSPVILLKNRPLPATIKVVYKGEEMPPGYPVDGGKWTYDPDVNGVRFHNLDFVDINEKYLKITYDVDDGQGSAELE